MKLKDEIDVYKLQVKFIPLLLLIKIMIKVFPESVKLKFEVCRILANMILEFFE